MYQRTTLANGLRVVTSTMPFTRSVTIAFFIGAGSRYEVQEQAGISHFLEHVLFKGTRRYPHALDISEGIEGLGGILNASTDREVTSYWCKIARSHFSAALDILTDMLRYPLFDAQEIERERLVIIEELRMTRDEPSSRAEGLLEEILWPDQPLGRDVGGTEESVTALSRDVLLEYLAAQYSPQNTVVSVAGDISHEEVVAAVAETMGDWALSETNSWYPSIDEQKSPRVKVERRKTDQAHIFLAVKGLSSTHSDRYPMDLLSTILGEGMSSRLFAELRERRGMAYEVQSYPTHLLDCGSLTIYTGVNPRLARQAIEVILHELHLVKDGIPEGELRKVKELNKGRLLLRMEDTHSVAGWIGAQELLHGHIQTVDQVLEAVEAVTPTQVKNVANQLLVTEKLNLVVVGPHRSEEPFRRLLTL